MWLGAAGHWRHRTRPTLAHLTPEKAGLPPTWRVPEKLPGSRRHGSVPAHREGFVLCASSRGAGRGEKCESRWKCSVLMTAADGKKTQECIRTMSDPFEIARPAPWRCAWVAGRTAPPHPTPEPWELRGGSHRPPQEGRPPGATGGWGTPLATWGLPGFYGPWWTFMGSGFTQSLLRDPWGCPRPGHGQGSPGLLLTASCCWTTGPHPPRPPEFLYLERESILVTP